MKKVDKNERYIQILTFQFVLDKELNTFLVDVLPYMNMNSMGQADNIIREGVINGMLDLVEPQIEKIQTMMLAIPSLKYKYPRTPLKHFSMKKRESKSKNINNFKGKMGKTVPLK